MFPNRPRAAKPAAAFDVASTPSTSPGGSRLNAPMSHQARRWVVVIAGVAAILLVVAFAAYVATRPATTNRRTAQAPTRPSSTPLRTVPASTPVGPAWYSAPESDAAGRLHPF